MAVVSVITPVFNGERFLGSSIESVLAQTFTDWEYVIVDNCSTDNTREIAASYAARDSRIRVIGASEHVPVTPSFNRSVRYASPDARYLKFLCADDLLFPDCLRLMVELAESHPNVALVGSYKIHGDTPICDGPPFPQDIVPGRDACRWFFEGRMGILGSETNHLIRLAAPRVRGQLFDDEYFHADIECFVRLLKDGADLGFVHQILTLTRVHSGAAGEHSHANGLGCAEFLSIVARHGASFLSPNLYAASVARYERDYHRFLVRARMKFWDRSVWRFQVRTAERFGLRVRAVGLLRAALSEAGATIAAPAPLVRALEREWRRVRESRTSSVQRSGRTSGAIL
jgi:glycosyltransferase involved in cell wall biosynthesis